jgi:hypothetical protein
MFAQVSHSLLKAHDLPKKDCINYFLMIDLNENGAINLLSSKAGLTYTT